MLIGSRQSKKDVASPHIITRFCTLIVSSQWLHHLYPEACVADVVFWALLLAPLLLATWVMRLLVRWSKTFFWGVNVLASDNVILGLVRRLLMKWLLWGGSSNKWRKDVFQGFTALFTSVRNGKITNYLCFCLVGTQTPIHCSPMPYHPVSKDLKVRILALIQLGYNVNEVCNLLGVKKSLIYQSLSYFHNYGILYNPHVQWQGHPCILAPEVLRLVVAHLKCRHCMYLNEIQLELYQWWGTKVSITTLLWTLHHLHYSHKSVSACALERDDLLQSAFMNRIADEVPNPNMLIFVDKAARNHKTSARMSGWSLVGKRCVQRRCFVLEERFSILPILTLDSIVTYDIVSGSITLERFLQFLCELVVSLCSSTFCHWHIGYRFPSPTLTLDLKVSSY